MCSKVQLYSTAKTNRIVLHIKNNQVLSYLYALCDKSSTLLPIFCKLETIVMFSFLLSGVTNKLASVNIPLLTEIIL